MNTRQRYIAVTEASSYAEPAAYISDILLSAEFLPPEDPDAEIDMKYMDELRLIWEIVNGDFRTLLSLMNLTQSECARRFAIPLRTIQHWAAGDRACPVYTKLMMAELAGLIDSPVE